MSDGLQKKVYEVRQVVVPELGRPEVCVVCRVARLKVCKERSVLLCKLLADMSAGARRAEQTKLDDLERGCKLYDSVCSHVTCSVETALRKLG